MGKAQSGEVCPAAKLSVTKDGFLDLATQSPDTATLIDRPRELSVVTLAIADGRSVLEALGFSLVVAIS